MIRCGSEVDVRFDVRVFGGLTDVVGAARISVEISEEANVGTLRKALSLAHPSLAPYLPRTAVAVDLEVADDDTPLAPDAEVALLPPVAGGAEAPRVVTGLRRPPFDVDAVSDSVAGSSAGATVMFLGTVRDHAPDLEDAVVALEYSAYEDMARRVLDEIAVRTTKTHPSVTGVALLHAVGELSVGDHTILVVTCAPHRAEAFDACRSALDDVKEHVPVFKQEHTAGGVRRWVGLTADDPPHGQRQ